MKTRVTTAALAAILLASAPVPAAQGEPESQPYSEIRQGYLVRIGFDPSVIPLDAPTVTMLLISPAVRAKVTRAVFGPNADSPNCTITFSALSDSPPPAPPGVLVGELYVHARSVTAAQVDALAKAACEQLRDALDRAGHAERDELVRQLERAERERAEIEARREHVFDLRKQLCDEAGQNDLSRERILDMSRQLENQKQTLEMDQVGQRARRRALQERVADLAAQTKEEIDDDEVLAAHRERLALQEKALQHIEKMFTAGVAPQTDVDAARAKVASAKADVAARAWEVARAVEGGLTEKLSSELATLAIDAAETEARLQFAREQLARVKDLLAQADRYERDVTMQLPALERAYESARQRIEELRRELDGARPGPTVTLIGVE